MPVKNKLSELKIGKYLKYAIFATNILAIFLLLVSSLAWIIEPSKMVFISYLGLAFPIILFINLAYFVLWLVVWRWRYALVQILAFAICWQPISACFPINFKSEVVPDNSIKILSYNVRGFNWQTGEKARGNPIFNYVLKNDADIVCFQEFFVSTGKKKDVITQTEVNNIMKDYPHRSVMRIGNRRSGVVYGIACYSKYPILKSEKIPIESAENGSVSYTLDVKGKKVSLIVNHLESNKLTSEDKKLYREFLKTRDRGSFDEMAHSLQNRLGAASEIREKQANVIRKYIEEQKTDATIVCGDFNDTPVSYAYHTIKGNLVDAYANTGLGQGITYHENYFLVRIDYIMHSAALQSHNFTVDKVKHSDHYPVWTYLSFK